MHFMCRQQTLVELLWLHKLLWKDKSILNEYNLCICKIYPKRAKVVTSLVNLLGSWVIRNLFVPGRIVFVFYGMVPFLVETEWICVCCSMWHNFVWEVFNIWKIFTWDIIRLVIVISLPIYAAVYVCNFLKEVKFMSHEKLVIKMHFQGCKKVESGGQT